MKRIHTLFTGLKQWFVKRSMISKAVIIILIGIIGWFIYSKLSASNTGEQQYQTAQVERGTLVVTVTGSGQVSAANSGSVSTQIGGVVRQLYVKNGDTVNAGDPLVEFDLDQGSQQKYSQASAAYQSAKNTLDTAFANQYTLQSDMFTKWSTFMDLAQNSTYQNSDGSPNTTNRVLPEFHVAQDDWLAAESKYKIQQAVIAQAQTALSSAWMTYKQTSPIVYAPISGRVTGLSLQPGSVISQETSSSSTTTPSSQKLASIVTDALPTVTVNLSEVDVTKVKTGDKVTLTVDVISGKTFTGEVMSIDTVGEVSSGVTTYPVVIKLDSNAKDILSNMNVSVSIITDTHDNVLLIPSSAVQSENGETYVRVLRNKQIQQVPVETGASSATQTEITSGLSEGDSVVTSIVSTNTRQSGQTQSPFSAIGGGRGFGGGAVRFNR